MRTVLYRLSSGSGPGGKGLIRTIHANPQGVTNDGLSDPLGKGGGYIRRREDAPMAKPYANAKLNTYRTPHIRHTLLFTRTLHPKV